MVLVIVNPSSYRPGFNLIYSRTHMGEDEVKEKTATWLGHKLNT